MINKEFGISVRKLTFSLALIVLGCSFASAQSYISQPIAVSDRLALSPSPTPSPGPSVQTDDNKPPQSNQTSTTPTKPKKEKRGSFIFAPIPISSPTFGSGLVLGLGYVFKLNKDDKLSPPSTIGLAGAFTNSGSRGGGLGGRLYFSENKYQTTVVIAKGRANFDFYGIGHIPGRDPIKVPLKAGGTVFFGEFLRNVWKDIFVGPRFQYRSLYASIDGIRPPGGFEVPAIDLKSISAALGFHVQRDKRDSTFYPRKGSIVDFAGNFFDQAFGSRREYQTYSLSYGGFYSVSEKQVLAYRAMGCSANGFVPFYDLCLYGSDSNLRGYVTGQFQNRRMFAGQAEYRVELPKRFGIVAFGGLGGIARNWNDFRMSELLPAAGAGLRFNLDKKNHINYRIDFAYGREGHTLSIGVGEAF